MGYTTCHAIFFWKLMHMQVQKKFLSPWLFHSLCRQLTFRDSSYPHVLRPKWPWRALCYMHPFGSSSHRTSQHAYQPNLLVNKLQKLAEALQKIKTFPTGKPFGACIPVSHKNTSASNSKPHCFNTHFVSSRFQMLLFRSNSNDREFPSNKYLETLSMIPFHDLSASDSTVRGPYCQLDVGLCDVDVFLHWISAAEEGAGVGLKPDLQGGTGFNLLRVHFWAPVQRNRI